MTMTTKSISLLNAIKDKMIEVANQNGISLADHFADVTEFKQFVMAFTFKVVREMGFETAEAFDIVFGEGSYDELTRSVFNICNA